jgi:hypothetical protein
MEIKLRNEVELVNGQKTKTIIMREPTRGDYKAIETVVGDVQKEDVLINRLTNIAIDSLDSVVMSDSAKLVNGLLEITGENYDPKP